MPHIFVRGIPQEELQSLSSPIKELVTTISQAAPSYVKIFHDPMCRMDAPEDVAIDVYWMHRPQDLCDRMANALTELFQSRSVSFVQVTFTEFPGNLFYENGIHY